MLRQMSAPSFMIGVGPAPHLTVSISNLTSNFTLQVHVNMVDNLGQHDTKSSDFRPASADSAVIGTRPRL